MDSRRRSGLRASSGVFVHDGQRHRRRSRVAQDEGPRICRVTADTAHRPTSPRSVTAVRNREMSEQSRAGRSGIRRPLAALGIVCLLMAGCNAADREPMAADPPPPTPTPGSSGALAYGVDGDIYVAEWDGSNPVRIADGRPPSECATVRRANTWGEGPIWSPDGRYLAYRHTDCDGPQDLVGRRDQRSGGQRRRIVPQRGLAHLMVARLHARCGLGPLGRDDRRLRARRRAPGAAHPAARIDGGGRLRPGVVAGRRVAHGSHGVEIPLDGSTPRKLPWADRPSDALQDGAIRPTDRVSPTPPGEVARRCRGRWFQPSGGVRGLRLW